MEKGGKHLGEDQSIARRRTRQLQYVVCLLSVRINHKYLAIKSSLASPAHDSTDTQGQMGKTLWWGVHLCSEDLSRWLDVIRFAEVSITLHYWLAHGVGLANTSTATKSFSFLPLSIKASWFSPSVDLDRLSMMSCKSRCWNIDKPKSQSQSKVQALNPRESNPKRDWEIWTLGCL